MSTSKAEQRMIDNEAVFRHHNEQVQRQLDELKMIAKEDGQEHMVPDHDLPLHFYCECADENCTERVQLKPSEYNGIHTNRRRFVIIPGHQVSEVERIISDQRNYIIVEKHQTPPETATKLQITPVDNF